MSAQLKKLFNDEFFTNTDTQPNPETLVIAMFEKIYAIKQADIPAGFVDWWVEQITSGKIKAEEMIETSLGFVAEGQLADAEKDQKNEIEATSQVAAQLTEKLTTEFGSASLELIQAVTSQVRDAVKTNMSSTATTDVGADVVRGALDEVVAKTVQTVTDAVKKRVDAGEEADKLDVSALTTSIKNEITQQVKNTIAERDIPKPTEAPTEAPTDAPTDAPTEAP
ncbi:hypothetical protein, partial [Thiomicrospira microaerophila]|uniref:hypothetical protein n=1 Tax=Thiomicrospira microaerophila TaxID=406020 RepID=UPI0005C977E3